jgi:hypothetical protein
MRAYHSRDATFRHRSNRFFLELLLWIALLWLMLFMHARSAF